MGAEPSDKTAWRDFERVVARIEAAAGPLGMSVKSPDRIRSLVTGRLREVDASIRMKMGTSDVLITIECRKRKPTQDVTWIEQLTTKKQAIGAARTIAVSSNGFSSDAQTAARFYGIDMRSISDLSIESINRLLKIDFVLFTRRNCALAGVRARFFRGMDAGWTVPSFEAMDWVAPDDVDPSQKIFTNTETGWSWSINDIWHQLQETVDPFEGIVEDQPWEVRTACFPYPGNVELRTKDGSHILGDVLLSVALSKTREMVTLVMVAEKT